MKLPYVIGLTGLKRCGKDTLIRHLCEHHGFLAFSWVEPLRQMLRALGVPEDYITGDRREEIVPGYRVSGRWLMQSLGTEWGRNLVGPDVWINGLLNSPDFKAALLRSPVVINGTRFTDEAQAVKGLGGKIWKVTRPGFIPDSHISEAGLPRELVDCYLENNSTPEFLWEQADYVLGQLS